MYICKCQLFWVFVKATHSSSKLVKVIFLVFVRVTLFISDISLSYLDFTFILTYLHIDFVSFYCQIHLPSIVLIKVYIDYTLTIFESQAPNQPELYCYFRKGNLQFLSIFMSFFFSFSPNFSIKLNLILYFRKGYLSSPQTKVSFCLR